MSDSKRGRFGVLLVNLGTPDAPTTSAVRRYLRAFLSDPRVIDTPKLIWWFILNGIILLVRPAKVAKLYRSIWTSEGSPLLKESRAQAAGLQQTLDERGLDCRVELAMTYGEPSVSGAIERLRSAGCERVLVIPLYPQYSATTTAAVIDAVYASQKQQRDLPEFRFVKSYGDHPTYIAALANSVKSHWQQNGQGQKLVMSFHGIPKRYADCGDPYPKECHKTAHCLAEALELEDEQWLYTYQSRFGPAEWLQPYTDKTLEALPGERIKAVDIISPAFTADCLETLEELKIQNQELFLSSGGERYEYIPALNADALFIQCLAELTEQHSQGW
ncbi:MAG: ferrochelatase [Pseudomonadales bacterium]